MIIIGFVDIVDIVDIVGVVELGEGMRLIRFSIGYVSWEKAEDDC